jgi:hypothetical protein
MSGSLFDYTQYDPTMGGMGPAGNGSAGAAPPTTLATMWDWLKRRQSPLTGLQPGQQVPNGQGLAMNPDGSVGTPGGGFNGPIKPTDPTVQAPVTPPPPPPGMGPSEWPPQASADPYRNAPSPASVPASNPTGASVAQIEAAPAPPTPAQAARSAQDTSGSNYNTDVQAAKAPPAAASRPDDSTIEQPAWDRAQAVRVGLIKRGMDPETATAFAANALHESSADPNTGAGDAGASHGLFQWRDQRAADYQKIYGHSPDKAPLDEQLDYVMHELGGPESKAYQTIGAAQGVDGKAAAVSTAYLRPKDTDAEATRRAATALALSGTPGAASGLGRGTAVAGPGAPTNTGTNYTPAQQSQLSALGIDPSTFQLPFDYNQAVQPSMSEKLYRMAAALQGNAGQAAGLMAGDRQKMLEANNNQLATQRLMGTLAYQNAGLGIKQQTANNGTVRATTGIVNSQTAQDRLKVAQDALAARTDPAVAARLAQGHTAGAAASKDISSTLSTQAIQADNQGLADIDNAQKLIQEKPELMGPTLAARWARFAAETGLSGQAADLNALQKMTTDQRNQMLSALTNGHVGGIRSNAELQNISKAVADVGTSPAAAQFILDMQKSQIEARNAWRQEIQDRYQSDPESITGQRYDMTRAQFLNDYNKAHPLPEYNSPTASNSAGNKPGVNASGSTKGAATLRYNQATGQMEPM